MPQKTDLTHIKQVIESRLRYFIQISLYVNQLQMLHRQNETEALPEAIEFIQDVMGMTCHDEEQIVQHILPQLKENIDKNKKRYANYRKAINHEHDGIGLATLAILLDYDTGISAQQNAGERDRSIKKDSRASMAFHDYEARKKIQKDLSSHLPDEYKSIRKIIDIKRFTQTTTQNKKSAKKNAAKTLYQQYAIDWKRWLLNEFKPVSDGLNNTLKRIVNDERLKLSSAEQESMKGELTNTLQTQMHVNSLKLADPNTDQFELIEGNLSTYYKLTGFIDKFKNVIATGELIKEEVEQKKKNKRQYQQMHNNLSKFLKQSIRQCLELSNQAKEIQKDVDYLGDEGTQEINLLLDKIQHCQDVLQKNQKTLPTHPQKNAEILPEQLQELNQHSVKVNDVLDATELDEISTTLITLKECVEEAKKREQEKQEAQAKAKKLAEAKIIEDRLQHLREQRRQRLEAKQKARAEKKAKADAWRQKVHGERSIAQPSRDNDDNDDVKVESPPSPSASSISLFKQTALSATASTSIKVTNKNFLARITNLPRKASELIEKIFANERGVKYDEVKNLIENRLGGSVLEIGNGSSHKRIILESLYSELYTHMDKTDNLANQNKATSSSSTVTGGMSKPHGGTHNSGILSRFNLKLITSVLKQAGVTPEKIALLQTNKSASPDREHIITTSVS